MFSKQVLAGVLSFLLTIEAVSAFPRHSSLISTLLAKRDPFDSTTSYTGDPQPPKDFATDSGPQAKSNYQYQCFGQKGLAYPKATQFISFDSMWDANKADVAGSNGGDQGAANSIKNAILEVSKKTNMYPQYTLAIVMQESVGNLKAKCTSTSQGQPDECGLMQASPGGTNANGNSSAAQQIEDGLLGTKTGGYNGKGRCGFVQIFMGITDCVGEAGVAVMKSKPAAIWPFWAGARLYNSGGADESDLETCPQNQGTPSYAMDVANRVLGWTGEHKDGECGIKAGAA
ncbi:MAG: hypothetical protein Q9165_001823 [Trypethelium subeluteriae]